MRKNTFLFLTIGITLAVVNDCSSTRVDSASSPGQGGAYYTGIYENLFSTLLRQPDATVRARIDRVFNQLFYGDDKTERVYCLVSPDMAYIEDVNNQDVRTEGMSYGMMICVQLDKKMEFDRLWKWAKTYMQIQRGPHKGYFAWHCLTDGTVLDSTAASDGEEWFVTSLFFASARWGDGTGIYAYRNEAQMILNTMLTKESETGHGRVTNMFREKEKLVSFVPDVSASDFTDPSYQAPHYYELWARWSDNNSQFWCDAASASRVLLRHAADSTTGLSPDYSHFDGTPISPWPGQQVAFRFDAWRVAMNLSMDHVWFGKDPWQVVEANRLLDFFWSQGVGTHGNQYTLNGEKLGDDHSKGLVAMNAVAAVASTNEKRREFVQEFWSTPVPAGPYRYYDGMLYMLAMLQVSGNFRVYHLTGERVSACSDK